MRTAATGLAGACAAAAAVAACGTPSPDLFVVHRSGDVPGAKLDLLVSDTSVRCNGKRHPLSSDQIIEARALTDDLLETQRDPVRPRVSPGRIFSFSVRSEEGTLRFGDTTRDPVLARVGRFTRTIAQDVCGLAR